MALKFTKSDFQNLVSSYQPRVSVTLEGLTEVVENIGLLKGRVITASAVGGKRVAVKVLNRALEYVPYDTGALYGTGRILDMAGEEVSPDDLSNYSVTWARQTPRGTKLVVEWRVAFGGMSSTGEDVDYAAIVHENPHGVTFRNGKRERYLAQAADEIIPRDGVNEIAATAHEAVMKAVAEAKKTVVPSALGGTRSMAPRLVKRS